jgi:hypothetical protein
LFLLQWNLNFRVFRGRPKAGWVVTAFHQSSSSNLDLTEFNTILFHFQRQRLSFLIYPRIDKILIDIYSRLLRR